MIEADLHIHTSKSYDSLQSPEIVARYAEQAGLDAIAITDHNAYGAHEEVRSKTDSVLVIPGQEIRTSDYDDLVGLFLDQPVESTTFTSAIDEIHRQDGIAILPHPYRKVSEYPRSLLHQVDAIERINARSKEKNNAAAGELAAESTLPTVGGSDAHTPWEIGRARTRIEAATLSPAALKTALLEGKVQPLGTESPYYLFHGLSYGMELYKSMRETVVGQK
ncbi:PHP domain-containing protein [Natribaculum luteum]|uniref:PHP domain-containing protein n=1 Tax=Natribaculum luteum TaxID=1586232 RepID=A0ABD5NX47_9EURY|nr:PHP domain-containing protein [Natribaculum luteum]